MIKRFFPLIVSAIVLAPLFFVHSCANTTEAPTGGDKDTIPPYIVDIKPLPGAVCVPLSGLQIQFTFNEYVVIKEMKNIFLSPPLEKAPVSKIKGKSLYVKFENELQPNTTYSLSLTNALADNNEGNMFPGFTYVFSTGEQIDSMYITGVVQDCNTLDPVKDATVMLYKDPADSAVFLHRPFAAAKTDDWGFFSIPYIKDTVYRLYAIKDAMGNNIYDPDNDLIAFVDSAVRPVNVVNDTIYELMKFNMKDTLECLARKTEYELNLFREKPRKQFLKNHKRIAERAAYISFNAPNVWIDSLWIKGYRPERIISQFNILQDSLELWVNDRRPAPDTLHLFVNYRKTDSTGMMKPYLEHLRMTQEGAKPKKRYVSKKDIKHEDTTCVFTMKAAPETFEREGFRLEFKYPIIWAKFDSLKFRYLNPRQKEFSAKVRIERDSTNLRCYNIIPDVKMQKGYEYFLKIPDRAFRDINGFYSDSLETKVAVPTDEDLSTLNVMMSGVDRKVIVDLFAENGKEVLRSYVVESDAKLVFPYLKEGRYSIRITVDGNRNSIVDTGSLLEHRQPERVVYYKLNGNRYIMLPKASEIDQSIDFQKLINM